MMKKLGKNLDIEPLMEILSFNHGAVIAGPSNFYQKFGTGIIVDYC
jgi:hypothetical protein